MMQRPDSLSDTIVACATAPGEGAIAVIRLSGPQARRIAGDLAGANTAFESHHMYRAQFRDEGGELLDSGMLVQMHGPRSYTGDDVVELHLHGARVIQRTVTERCVQLGARHARAGEFTQRAFLNGKLDLAQAEAVGDLINARSQTQQRIATGHLRGEVSSAAGTLVSQLEGILATWRATLDFPEYELDAPLETLPELDTIICKIQSMLDRARVDAHQGRQIVLAGAPNVGKSTLLNTLAGHQRVLVDATPGTTRDPVEIEINSGPGRWLVCDTAGIRGEAEGLEAAGIAMSRQRMAKADHVLWLIDPQNPQWPSNQDGPVTLVASKNDLLDTTQQEKLKADAGQQGLAISIWLSAKSGEGIDALWEHLGAGADAVHEGEVHIVRQRHVLAFRRTLEALVNLRRSHGEGVTLDLLSMDLECAIATLGEVLGRNVDEEVLDRIFSEFCIGK